MLVQCVSVRALQTVESCTRVIEHGNRIPMRSACSSDA